MKDLLLWSIHRILAQSSRKSSSLSQTLNPVQVNGMQKARVAQQLQLLVCFHVCESGS